MIDLKDAHALKVTSIEASAAIEKQEAVNKVWSLTQFFSVSFLLKIIDLPGGQINDPLSGKHFLFRSSQQLPRLRLRPLKGFLS